MALLNRLPIGHKSPLTVETLTLASVNAGVDYENLVILFHSQLVSRNAPHLPTANTCSKA